MLQFIGRITALVTVQVNTRTHTLSFLATLERFGVDVSKAIDASV